jgi:hypothetical protein
LAPYTISFLSADRAVLNEEVRWFAHDDHALDEVGRSAHPHGIVVKQGERLVAEFPPWPDPHPPWRKSVPR